MTDSDERLSKRYRELAREEPPPLVDQAILASARRAVAPRARNRWAVPASIAAVLVLGVGVSLRMQSEKPGIESSLPSSPSEYSVPRANEPAPAAPPAAQPVPQAPPQPRLQAEAQPTRNERDAAPPAAVPRKKDAALERRDPKPFADAPAAPAAKAVPFEEPPAAPMQQARAPESPPLAKLAAPTVVTPDSAPAAGVRAPPQSVTSVASAPPPAMAAAAPSRPARAAVAQDNAATGATEMRAKREAPRQESLSYHEAPVPRDIRVVELERIAKLRAEGRHDEADKALEEFRRKHPDFRIPEATWEKVRPR